MISKLKGSSALILGITALMCSRGLFALFRDPEGPNLLVVAVLAVILYAVSLALYLCIPAGGPKRLSAALLAQLLLVAGLYFLLK